MNPLLLFGLALALFVLGGKAVQTLDARGRFVHQLGPILRQLGMTEEAARLALAHAGVETVFGTAGTSRSWETFNFWNVTAGSSWRGPTLAGGDRDASGAAITQAWRVYASPQAAALDYLELLSLPRYFAARQALLLGDAETFVAELWSGGYFEANPTKYLAMLTAARAQVAVLAPERFI